MNERKQKVIIKLQSTIGEGNEEEQHSIKQVGYFFNRNKLDVITFTEETDDAQNIHHFLSIYPNKVNIKRSGAVQMNQQFQVNQATECMLQLPHGNIHMETYTHSIKYESIRNKNVGKLDMTYSVKLNGQTERRHQLRVTYHKEDAK